MGSMRNIIRRELRVAFSTRAQPVWFRIAKWIVIVAVSVLFWRRPAFWLWSLGAMAVSLIVHFIWRWKTNGWTRPWGGWGDIETAKQR
jgi:hypothetical protein